MYRQIVTSNLTSLSISHELFGKLYLLLSSGLIFLELFFLSGSSFVHSAFVCSPFFSFQVFFHFWFLCRFWELNEVQSPYVVGLNKRNDFCEN